MALAEGLKLHRELGALFPAAMDACMRFAGAEEWTPALATGL